MISVCRLLFPPLRYKIIWVIMMLKGEMLVKRIKISALIICFALLLAAIAPAAKIEKSDLIAQILIIGYDHEDYLLQVTDNGALFAFRGNVDFLKNEFNDLTERFDTVFEERSRRLTNAEYNKLKAVVEDVKSSAFDTCGCIVECRSEVFTYTDSNAYFCSYDCRCMESEPALRLAYNLVLMSPIKSGSRKFDEEIIKGASKAIRGYANQFGKKIEPRL